MYNSRQTDSPSRNAEMGHFGKIADLISAGFGSGWLSKAPGTVGSAAAVLAWLAWHAWWSPTSATEYLLIVTTITVVGLYSVRDSLRRSQSKDPGWIVIDEWAGMFLALTAANPISPLQIACAFALFRLFDIMKPGPVRWAEALPQEYGVMADDLVAGLLALLLMQVMRSLTGSFGWEWLGGAVW
jgi:phosphatidylglycerophosphatase A